MKVLGLSLLFPLLVGCHQIEAGGRTSQGKTSLRWDLPKTHSKLTSERYNKQKKRNFEFVIPNVSNPNNGKAKGTLSEQIDENSKYLKKLQDDMLRQVNTVNNETIEQQSMDDDLINKSLKYPQRIQHEPLQKLLPNHLKQPLLNVALNPLKVLLDSNVLGIHRDLIGNMDTAGNMNHLKKLMKHMANDVLTANIAMSERTRKKQKEDMETLNKQNKTKTKEKQSLWHVPQLIRVIF